MLSGLPSNLRLAQNFYDLEKIYVKCQNFYDLEKINVEWSGRSPPSLPKL
jgi:hypothetical protein